MVKRSCDTLLSGYLESYKYFHHIYHKILEEMTFKRDIRLQEEDSLRRTLRSKASLVTRSKRLNVTYIGIHVRRTDMTKPKRLLNGFNTPMERITARRWLFFKKRYTDSVFVVVSDDLGWAKKNIEGSRSDAFVLESKGSPVVDMAILGMCNHSIMSVGTFGWWWGLASWR